MDFFGLLSLKYSSKYLNNKINYHPFDNEYFDIEVSLFNCIKNQKMNYLKILEKIYDVKNILSNEKKYLELSIINNGHEMFIYLENHYFENNVGKYTYEHLIKDSINKENLSLIKYFFDKIKKDDKYNNDKSFLQSIIKKGSLTGNLSILKEIINNFDISLACYNVLLYSNYYGYKFLPKNDNSDSFKFLFTNYLEKVDSIDSKTMELNIVKLMGRAIRNKKINCFIYLFELYKKVYNINNCWQNIYNLACKENTIGVIKYISINKYNTNTYNIRKMNEQKRLINREKQKENPKENVSKLIEIDYDIEKKEELLIKAIKDKDIDKFKLLFDYYMAYDEISDSLIEKLYLLASKNYLMNIIKFMYNDNIPLKVIKKSSFEILGNVKNNDEFDYPHFYQYDYKWMSNTSYKYYLHHYKKKWIQITIGDYYNDINRKYICVNI